jgi:hypothetical protein
MMAPISEQQLGVGLALAAIVSVTGGNVAA